MAVFTLTFSDTDLDANKLTTTVDATGEELQAGTPTPAYFAGCYIQALMNEPEFGIACGEYGNKLVEAILEDEPHLAAPTKQHTMVLTLEDKDASVGHYTAVLTGDEGTATELPSPAQITGSFLRALILKAEFRTGCFQYAEAFVANAKHLKIANTPATLSSNDDAASLAA